MTEGALGWEEITLKYGLPGWEAFWMQGPAVWKITQPFFHMSAQ